MKKAVSILLCMVLCFGIFGTTAFAQEDQISEEQNILQSEGAVNVGEDNSQGDLNKKNSRCAKCQRAWSEALAQGEITKK